MKVTRELWSGVVTGSGRDDAAAGRTVELNVMEGAVAFQVLRFVDEPVLTAQIGVDDTQVSPDGFAGLIEEDGAAGLGGECGESFLSVGEERLGFGAKDVDCRVGFLADIDVVLETSVAGVVDAVGEEEDEVAGERVCRAELIAAGFVDGVEESSAADATGEVVVDVAETGGEGFAVRCPILHDLRLGVETHHKGTIGLLAKELGHVFARYGLVPAEISKHGSAGVHEDAEVNGKILMDFEGEDLAGLFVVIEEVEISELQVIYGDAVEVGGVEGETHFVYGYVEGVGLGVRRWSGRLRVRNRENADYRQQCSEIDEAFAPMTGHGEQV
jgi:hypothetical protein